jgi:hypothetical protein
VIKIESYKGSFSKLNQKKEENVGLKQTWFLYGLVSGSMSSRDQESTISLKAALSVFELPPSIISTLPISFLTIFFFLSAANISDDKKIKENPIHLEAIKV